jgi:hypothetical protein
MKMSIDLKLGVHLLNTETRISVTMPNGVTKLRLQVELPLKPSPIRRRVRCQRTLHPNRGVGIISVIPSVGSATELQNRKNRVIIIRQNLVPRRRVVAVRLPRSTVRIVSDTLNVTDAIGRTSTSGAVMRGSTLRAVAPRHRRLDRMKTVLAKDCSSAAGLRRIARAVWLARVENACARHQLPQRSTCRLLVRI